MGHKVHPTIFRIGGIYNWPSKWFGRENVFRAAFKQDIELRLFLRAALKAASVDRIEIDRSRGALIITIFTARPGMVIGTGGKGIEDLKVKIQKKFRLKDAKTALNVNVVEIKNPALSAQVVLQGMIADIEKRMPFRRVMKQGLDKVSKAGAKGGKVHMAGRLNGAEIARGETLSFGKLPLQNLRADIDYACGEAHTIYGKIGIKMWIYRGEVFEKDEAAPALHNKGNR